MGIATRAPSCIFECYNDDLGRMDPYKYYKYKAAQRNGLMRTDYLKIVAMCEMIAKDETKEQVQLSRKRGPYAPEEERYHRDSTGEVRKFGPRDTKWYHRHWAIKSFNVNSVAVSDAAMIHS